MFSQEELSKSDQDVEKSKHHKKHYEDKRKVHINTIQALKASLDLKEQELTVRLDIIRAIFCVCCPLLPVCPCLMCAFFVVTLLCPRLL